MWLPEIGFVYSRSKIKVMSNPILKFLLDKKRKGLPMNIGEAMSETNTWVSDCKEGSMGPLMNHFREVWEKNNK